MEGIRKKSFKDNPRTGASLIWFLLTLVGIALVTALGPAEKTLGSNVRVVYLHGAWVWTALAAIFLAALLGLAALVMRKQKLHLWSRALGRTGLIFWVTYLPVSLWAMQTNWNGLFLVEPRWRFALIFALGGIVIQLGLVLVENPVWASISNVLYFLVLMLAFSNVENVMHPPGPIFNSNAPRIQLFFSVLLIMTLLAAWQILRWLFRLEVKRLEA